VMEDDGTIPLKDLEKCAGGELCGGLRKYKARSCSKRCSRFASAPSSSRDALDPAAGLPLRVNSEEALFRLR
jgi:hypothetical protein